MFQIKRATSKHLTFATLLVLWIQWLSGFSSNAQGVIPLGTYVTTVTENAGTLRPIGDYKVVFLEGGKFQMIANETITASGTYTIAGDRVEFTLPFGTGACATKGVYQWSLIGNRLSLAPATSDSCTRRPGRAWTYFKIEPTESNWKNLGPVGGTIKSLLIYDGKIFAGTEDLATRQQFGFGGPGVFVSSDNGNSWKATRGIRGANVNALAAFNGMLFAGLSSNGFAVSLDGGQTWEMADRLGTPSFVVTGFAVLNGKLYASATRQGILRLTENPYVWERITTTGLTNLTATAIAAIGANLFVSTDGDGVFTSTNGVNWTAVNNGISLLRVETLTVEGATLYAGTLNETSNEVYYSVNNGQSWTRVGNGLAASFPAGYPNQIYKLAVSGGRVLAASSNGIILNEGGNWSVIYQGSPTPFFISIVANGNQLFAGAPHDGMVRSFDGGVTWSPINNGLTARTVNAVIKESGSLIAAVNDGGFISNDDGQSWRRIGLPLGYVRNFLAFDGKLWAGAVNGVHVSADQGQTWTRVSAGLPASTVTRIVAVNNQLYASLSTAGVYRSTDGGQNWTAFNANLTDLRVNDLIARGNFLFAATESSGMFRAEAVGSWSPINNGLPASGIYALAVSGNNLLAALFGQTVYRTNDNGDSWTPSASGVGPSNLFTLYASGANVYASGGLNVGALRSTDNGLSWNLANAGFDSRYAYGFFASEAKLYAATTFGVCASTNLVNQQASVSAANYSPNAIVERSIVAMFGPTLAMSTVPASTIPLPTDLAGTTVKVRDSYGVERLAPIFYVSPDQVNYQIPAGTSLGAAAVMITNGNGIGASGAIDVKLTAPSVFTLNAQGFGPAAAVDAIRYSGAPFDAKQSNGEPNILAVFGTGLGSDATDTGSDVSPNVTARIDGNVVTLLYAGPAPGLVGVNQFNLVLPANITSGAHTLTLTRSGATSNTTTLTIR